MLKKLFLVALCAFFTLSVFSCSSITMQTIQGKNGNISCSLTIDGSDLTTNQKQVTYDFIQEYSSQLVSAYRDKMIELFSNVYDFEELNITSDEGKFSHIILYNENYKMLAGDIEFSLTREQFTNGNNNILTISEGYFSIYAYMMFFSPDAYFYDSDSNSVKFNSETYKMLIDVPILPSDYEIEESALMTTYLQTCVPFYYNGSEPLLLKDYTTTTQTHTAGTTLVTAICNELGVDENEANFIFSFATPFSRLHSNSTSVVENSGYIHTWVLGNDINAEILLWRNYSNYTPWYVISLSAGIAVVTIGFLVTFILKKCKKIKKIENGKKVDDEINKK